LAQASERDPCQNALMSFAPQRGVEAEGPSRFQQQGRQQQQRGRRQLLGVPLAFWVSRRPQAVQRVKAVLEALQAALDRGGTLADTDLQSVQALSRLEKEGGPPHPADTGVLLRLARCLVSTLSRISADNSPALFGQRASRLSLAALQASPVDGDKHLQAQLWLQVADFAAGAWWESSGLVSWRAALLEACLTPIPAPQGATFHARARLALMALSESGCSLGEGHDLLINRALRELAPNRLSTDGGRLVQELLQTSPTFQHLVNGHLSKCACQAFTQATWRRFVYLLLLRQAGAMEHSGLAVDTCWSSIGGYSQQVWTSLLKRLASIRTQVPVLPRPSLLQQCAGRLSCGSPVRGAGTISMWCTLDALIEHLRCEVIDLRLSGRASLGAMTRRCCEAPQHVSGMQVNAASAALGGALTGRASVAATC